MNIFLLLLATTCLAGAHIHGYNRHIYRSVPPSSGETYALLVAGSNGWYNYRHQADVGHAYHTLINHGIPEENIIVMMYDDVAHNKMNPFPGKLFNRPLGDDVYKGLNIDYKGKAVTPSNFLNVLKGNESGVVGGNGRVIDSTPEDRIFVFFTDHGATGLISFPDEMMTAKELNDNLVWMSRNNRFSQLVFYLEACESGSMFDDVLKKNLNIYAITAANGHESSWGTYCENDMNLPCLGDLFSVNWMTDSDQKDLDMETLSDQYELVKKETNKSHVMHFGDFSMMKEPVGWFQGEKKKRGKRIYYVDDSDAKASVWPARDIELMTLHRERERENNIYTQKRISHKIRRIHQIRRSVKTKFHSVVDYLVDDVIDRRRIFEERNTVENLECHHLVSLAFDRICIDFNKYDYALKYAYVLNNLCIEIGDPDQIIDGLLMSCTDV